jgi:methyl-accepting chemotaxis protein
MRLHHSLKFQFIVFFLSFIIAISAVAGILGTRQMSGAVEDTFADQGIFLVERAASYINGDAFEALVKSQDLTDPFYEETRVKLFELKESSGCLYLYTMAPYTDDIWHFIIDGSAAPDDKENFSALGDEEDVSEYDAAFKRVLKTKKTEKSHLVYQEGWGWLVSVYTPILNSAGDLVGVTSCDFDGEHLHQIIISGLIKNLIIGIVSVIVGLVILLFFLRKIFMPLGIFSTTLENSLGKGDLTKHIDIKNENEMGKLAENFNITIEKIRNLVVQIKEEAGSLSGTGYDLADNMNVTAGAVKEINNNIQIIKKRILNQSAGVTQTHQTMEKVVENINKLNSHIDNQSNHISQASSSIEEMVANINSVTGTLVNNAKNVITLRDASEAGRTGLSHIAADIQEIVKESEGLLQINSVMENIASQTNLLSMNAAIEAAHAGESGKGFAVVAGEIRKLAESSSNQSKTIGTVLKKIKVSIDKINHTTEAVIKKFEDIDESVKVVSLQEENIRNAMEEQGVGSKQILEGIGGVNQITRQVTTDSVEMHESAKEVIRESKNLEQETLEITSSMNEMANNADQINMAVQLVNEISMRNRRGIDTLIKEVSQFNV